MPVNFRQRAAALEQQLAQVRGDLARASEADARKLRALKASLENSLRWYRSRAGTRSDIHALRASVSEDVHTQEAGV